jgi:hypothetical protein
MESDMLDRLLQKAFLYDDPTAFRAGVETTMRELAHLLPPIEGHTSAPPPAETGRAVS